MNQLMKRIGIVLSILAFFFMMEPLDALASVKNQMINEECLKNPEACNEEPAAEEGNPDSAVGITAWDYVKMVFALIFVLLLLRSEERRVGKECRSGGCIDCFV